MNLSSVRDVVPFSAAMSDENLDRDSFLPSAISRYHQLFVPAMQLVGVLLAAVGPKHATVQKQVSHPRPESWTSLTKLAGPRLYL